MMHHSHVMEVADHLGGTGMSKVDRFNGKKFGLEKKKKNKDNQGGERQWDPPNFNIAAHMSKRSDSCREQVLSADQKTFAPVSPC